MKTERNSFPWPLFLVGPILALTAGYGLGFGSQVQKNNDWPVQKNHQREMVEWNGPTAQTEDAMRRWAPKGIGGHRTPEQMLKIVRENYSPVLMAFPTKRLG